MKFLQILGVLAHFIFAFPFQSLTHFQPFVEESLGVVGRDRNRGHFHPPTSTDVEIPGILPPPAKMFYHDNSDNSTSTSEQSTLLHTFPRQRRMVDVHNSSTFLPPPPPPHCDDFASHSMNKSDRRKTVTFLGDVETIDVDATMDFFPLPPPLLPHSDNDVLSERQKSCDVIDKKSSDTNSPDYVESSV